MEAYSAVKLLHVTCALISISGFIYRFVLLKHRVDLKAKFTTKVLPHIIDTVLLGSAVGLIIMGPFDLLSEHWLLAKIVLLVAYIGFGMKALKPKIDDEVRRKAFNAACICIFLILCLAFEHLFRVNKGDLLSNGAQKATVVEEYDHSKGKE
ncbi:MAG: SirB2 family protein [Planctomycetales bacterium]|nr:SirB2 family protein [bacterium]UNM07383.1 MAG: SirB2 family protein [Planctomycetales bacterium]